MPRTLSGALFTLAKKRAPSAGGASRGGKKQRRLPPVRRLAWSDYARYAARVRTGEVAPPDLRDERQQRNARACDAGVFDDDEFHRDYWCALCVATVDPVGRADAQRMARVIEPRALRVALDAQLSPARNRKWSKAFDADGLMGTFTSAAPFMVRVTLVNREERGPYADFVAECAPRVLRLELGCVLFAKCEARPLDLVPDEALYARAYLAHCAIWAIVRFGE